MPFEKGKIANPKGRPPVKNSLSDILRSKLDEVGEDGKTTNKEAIAERFVNIALTGKDTESIPAIKYIFDRLDGSPKQTIEAEIKEVRPITYSLAMKGLADGSDGETRNGG